MFEILESMTTSKKIVEKDRRTRIKCDILKQDNRYRTNQYNLIY